MEFSLSAAAKATGKGKSTIHNAIKSGKLSARRTEGGSYQIDASELARVFTLNPPEGFRMDDPEPPVEPAGTEVAVLRTEVAMLREQLAREREMIASERELSRDTIDDLRKRLDRAEERTHALTHQVSQAQDAAKPKGFLHRLLGLA